MEKSDNIKNHFNNISDSYDINNEKLYWKLSDEILWQKISENIPNKKDFNFLDLGGGTGEWTRKILEKYPNSTATLIDFSPGMLKEAEKKLKDYKGRINIIESDINGIKNIGKYDLILNIYLLPFFDNLDYLFSLISSSLKNGGICISVGENYYNGLSLNLLKGNMTDVSNLINHSYGTLSKYVPSLRFDKINDLEEIHHKYNIDIKLEFGFPVLSLIGVKEALTDNDNSISKILGSDFNEILQLELSLLNDETLTNRGKYICVIGVKNEKES